MSATTPDPTPPRAGDDAPVVVSIDPEAHEADAVTAVLRDLRERGLAVTREHAGQHCHAWAVYAGGDDA